MLVRLHSSAVFVLIVATLGLWAVGISGQSKPSYAPPRTPWGDPDLQGTYTNKYEQSTPLERPDQFAGRRVEDVSGEDLIRRNCLMYNSKRFYRWKKNEVLWKSFCRK